MKNYKYLYGPVPSRRMGLSLGISPIPDRTCSYSCIYCQLGKTTNLTDQPQDFFPLAEMKAEIDRYFLNPKDLDVVTIVGEGEPTLYADLGGLIDYLKTKTDKALAVITNGAFLYRPSVAQALMRADIILPSVDTVMEKTFRCINRPAKGLVLEEVLKGIRDFSQRFTGQIWLETMLLKDRNDSEEELRALKDYIKTVSYDRLYINTPVRPPALSQVQPPTKERLAWAVNFLEGIAIDQLVSQGFVSDIEDDLSAIISIITRHPMNQHEIRSFLEERKSPNPQALLEELGQRADIIKVAYKGYVTYRIK